MAYEIISKESPLRRLPEAIEPRQRVIFDGVRYAAQTIGRSYSRLVAALSDFSVKRGDSETPMPFTEAFTDAWSLIDATHRLRPLILKISNAEAIPEVSAFKHATKNVYALRNKIQHFDGAFEWLVSRKEDVWGTITWVTVVPPELPKVGLHAIAAGSMFSDRNVPIENPCGKILKYDQNHNSIVRVTLHAYGLEILLDGIMDSLKQLVASLERCIALQSDGVSHMGSDAYFSVTFSPAIVLE